MAKETTYHKRKSNLKSKAGSQPLAHGVAYTMGRDCAVGREFELIIGLSRFWPNLPNEEAFNSLLDGLSSRFDSENTAASVASSEPQRRKIPPRSEDLGPPFAGDR